MLARKALRGTFWVLVAVVFVYHAAGGWYVSSQVIADEFAPAPNPVTVPEGDYRLDEVTYSSDLGDFDAWFLPSFRSLWVIHVHGVGTTPAEAEHLFFPLQDAGYPQLAITYRNDEGQPSDPSGYYQYGATEWRDVEGAVNYAKDNGAEGVVLSGIGTGASHVLAFAYRNNLDIVKGILLDSPELDMAAAVGDKVSHMELPGIPIFVAPTVVPVANFLTSLRIEVNWEAIDYAGRASNNLRKPVLVHHGTSDITVSVEQSISLAESAPDLVRLIQVEGAGHVGSYAADPGDYVAEVLGFLIQVG